MSEIKFFASEYKLPEIDYEGVKYIEVNGLFRKHKKRKEQFWIYSDASSIDQISYFTDLPFIYWVDIKGDVDQVIKLKDYINKNHQRGKRLELWSLWCGSYEGSKRFEKELAENRENLTKKEIKVEDLKLEDLNELLEEPFAMGIIFEG